MDMGIKHLMEQAMAVLNTSGSIFKQPVAETEQKQQEMFPTGGAVPETAPSEAAPSIAVQVRLLNFKYISIGGLQGQIEAHGLDASGRPFSMFIPTNPETSPQDLIGILQEIMVRFG